MAVWTTELAPPRPAAGKLAPVSHWRIHIGAHKTATTHLQQTLAAIRPRLVEQGIDPIPLGGAARQRPRPGADRAAAGDADAAAARPRGPPAGRRRCSSRCARARGR